MTYEVGKFYKVPCVRGMWHHLTRDWPVMGAFHSDAEIINFKEWHYHIDWRFVSKLPLLDVFGSALKGFADPPKRNYITPLVTTPRMNPNGLPKPVMRRRKCQRPHSLPWEIKKKFWLQDLEKAYAGCKLAAGHVCPHRGYDLSHEPVDASGIVTCPLHGLRWNINSGEAAPRCAESSNECCQK